MKYEIIKKIIKKTLTGIINIIILLITLVIPKNNKIMIVGGWYGKRFADNSRYAYLSLFNNNNYLPVWITRDQQLYYELKGKGIKVYKAWSIKSIWYHLRAKIHIIDHSINDINPYFSVRAKKINLWHGFPIKKIGDDKRNQETIISSIKSKINNYLIPGFWGKQYLLATSEYSAEVLGKAFQISKEKIIISNYPRNYMLDKTSNLNQISIFKENEYINTIDIYKKNEYTIIGYFPTFRDKTKTKLFGLSCNEDIKSCINKLYDNKILLITKMHFVEKNIFNNNCNKYINIEAKYDIYKILEKIDILITDYSSIYYDYLLLKRPIIFFPYDLDYYIESDRGLMFDYNDYTPGDKYFDVNIMIKSLKDIGMKNYDKYYNIKFGKHAENIRNLVFNNCNCDMTDIIKKLNKKK